MPLREVKNLRLVPTAILRMKLYPNYPPGPVGELFRRRCPLTVREDPAQGAKLRLKAPSPRMSITKKVAAEVAGYRTAPDRALGLGPDHLNGIVNLDGPVPETVASNVVNLTATS